MKLFLKYFLSFLVYHYVEGNGFSANFITPSGVSVNEGSSLIFMIESTDGEGVCNLVHPKTGSTASAADYSLYVSNNGNQVADLSNFAFGQTGFKTMTATVGTTVDGDPTETLIFSLECTFNGNSCPAIASQFSIVGPGSSGGDPHFFQAVIDSKTGKYFDICYDVIGKSGQVIDIFVEKQLKIDVKGALLDDYFMHKMFISYPKFNFTFERKGCFVNGNFLTGWQTENGSSIIHLNKFSITKSKNHMQIINNEYPQFPISIFKRSAIYQQFYLDVAVNGLGKDYTDQDGLLGRMGNNIYEFLPTVQTDSNAALRINGIQRTASELVRNGKKCLFIDVKDAIYPKSLSDFVK